MPKGEIDYCDARSAVWSPYGQTGNKRSAGGKPLSGPMFGATLADDRRIRSRQFSQQVWMSGPGFTAPRAPDSRRLVTALDSLYSMTSSAVECINIAKNGLVTHGNACHVSAFSREISHTGNTDQNGNPLATLLTVPDFCMICLLGPDSTVTSAFAAQHFQPAEIMSCAASGGLNPSGEIGCDTAPDPLDLVCAMTSNRLAGRDLAVIHTAGMKRKDRKRLVSLAKKYHAGAVAIAFNFVEGSRDLPGQIEFGRNSRRRATSERSRQLGNAISSLPEDGFRHVYTLSSPEEVATA